MHFNLDYVNADGNISNYYPDFVVKTTDGLVTIVETKGEEDMDVPLKMARLKQWCEDINSIQKESHFDFVFVDEEAFHDYSPRDFVELKKTFVRYKE